VRHREERRRNGLISVGGGEEHCWRIRRGAQSLSIKEEAIVKMALINRFEHLNKKPHHEKAE
jgi:hypothetical protein